MADSIVGALLESKAVRLDDRERIAGKVENVILADLEAEERLEEEARELLNKHYEMVRAEGAEYGELLRKIKAKLAQDRGIVI